MKRMGYLKALWEKHRPLLWIILFLAHPVGPAEKQYRVEHVPALHPRGALASLVGISGEKPPLRINRAPSALKSALKLVNFG